MTGQVDAQARRRAQLDADWRAYLAWEAQLRIKLRAELELQLMAELRAQARAFALAQPDPLLRVAPPVPAPRRSPRVDYPLVQLGLLNLCAGYWTGSERPRHVGYCPPVRVRLDRDWSVGLDPSLLRFVHGDETFTTVGVHPSLFYSFVNGRQAHVQSHGYVLAGLDAWWPVTNQSQTPNGFWGVHVGFGAELSSDYFAMGMELRMLGRGGLGGHDSPLADDMSSWRLGFEARLNIVTLVF